MCMQWRRQRSSVEASLSPHDCDNMYRPCTAYGRCSSSWATLEHTACEWIKKFMHWFTRRKISYHIQRRITQVKTIISQRPRLQWSVSGWSPHMHRTATPAYMRILNAIKKIDFWQTIWSELQRYIHRCAHLWSLNDSHKAVPRWLAPAASTIWLLFYVVLPLEVPRSSD